MGDTQDDVIARLSEPFPETDVEWRVQSASQGRSPIVRVLAYLTARAVQQRLDDVVGPANWYSTPATMLQITPTIVAMQVGIAIRINGEWVTKYDVAEPTQVEAVKGGYSGAMKRAGVQWGIGRYLYHLEAALAEAQYLTEGQSHPGPGWRQHKSNKLPGVVYWRPPRLPSWAIPDWEKPITEQQLKDVKRLWYTKFGHNCSGNDAAEQFAKFVTERTGQFPVNDHRTWTARTLDIVTKKITDTPAAGGPTNDVPFGSTPSRRS